MTQKLRRLSTLFAVIALSVCAPSVFALRGVMLVTKDTQAKLGLVFTLIAEKKSEDVVIIDMEIPRKGKLKSLHSVDLNLGTPSGYPAISAPLQTKTGKNGAWLVRLQLSPEMAEKCSLDLSADAPPTAGVEGIVYSVAIKTYIAAKK